MLLLAAAQDIPRGPEAHGRSSQRYWRPRSEASNLPTGAAWRFVLGFRVLGFGVKALATCVLDFRISGFRVQGLAIRRGGLLDGRSSCSAFLTESCSDVVGRTVRWLPTGPAFLPEMQTLVCTELFWIPWSNRPVVIRKEQCQCELAAGNRTEADMPMSLR